MNSNNNRSKTFNREKYQERMAKEINSFLRSSFSDPRIQMVSVTHVELNRDFSVAKVFWDTFDPSIKEDATKALANITGKMRSLLTNVIKVRHIPAINFVYNSQFEDENRITQLITSSDE